MLALSIWRRRKAVRPQVRYQVLETRHPRRFGFSGESWEPERHLVVLLPGREQAEVEQLVRRLNQRQIPIQDLAVRGALLAQNPPQAVIPDLPVQAVQPLNAHLRRLMDVLEQLDIVHIGSPRS